MKNLHIVNGYGELGWDKVLQIVTTTLATAGFFAVLYAGEGLIGLGAVFLASSLVYWLGSTIIIRRFVGEVGIPTQVKVDRGEMLQLFRQASKMLVLALAAFLVMYTDVFIVERLFGLKTLPLFSALVKVVTLIIAVSTLLQQMMYPYVAIKWSQRNFQACRALYLKGIVYSVGIAVITAAVALALAPVVIPLWLGQGTYLGSTVFGLQLLYGIIYIHHCAHATPVVATGENAFVIPAIVHAVIAVPSAILGGLWFGIPGIIIGNILAMALISVYVVSWTVRFFNSTRFTGNNS